MKSRFFVASLLCVAALGAAMPSTLAGEKTYAAATETDELPGEWPKVVSHVAPLYPAALHAAKIQGEVQVSLIVTKDGDPTQVEVQSSDHADFNAPAIEAVKQWKFTPGLKGGRPVNTRMVVPIRFELAAEKPAK